MAVFDISGRQRNIISTNEHVDPNGLFAIMKYEYFNFWNEQWYDNYTLEVLHHSSLLHDKLACNQNIATIYDCHMQCTARIIKAQLNCTATSILPLETGEEECR